MSSLRTTLTLWRREIGPLTRLALAVALPVAVAVLLLDLWAWSPPPAGEADGARRLGDELRWVREPLWLVIALARYALGAVAYLIVILYGARLIDRGSPGIATGPPHSRALALVVVLVFVIAARLLISTVGEAALAPLTADPGAGAYLVAINVLHAIGKVLTAPALAAAAYVALPALRRR